MSFWIGDKVVLKKSGRVGLVAELLQNGKIKVKVDDKMIITGIGNVEIIPENDFEFPDWIFGEDEKKQNRPMNQTPKQVDHIIDLHMEKLEPGMVNAAPGVILPFQIKQCKLFLEKNIQKRRSIVQVICGKGEGVLKQEIIHMVQHDFNVRFIFEKNEGGMLEIWL